jgi:hypothetical protein
MIVKPRKLVFYSQNYLRTSYDHENESEQNILSLQVDLFNINMLT